MTIEDIYLGFGMNWTDAMRELNLSPSAYKNWQRIGYIPPKTQKYIEKISRGRFRAANLNANPTYGPKTEAK